MKNSLAQSITKFSVINLIVGLVVLTIGWHYSSTAVFLPRNFVQFGSVYLHVLPGVTLILISLLLVLPKTQTIWKTLNWLVLTMAFVFGFMVLFSVEISALFLKIAVLGGLIFYLVGIRGFLHKDTVKTLFGVD